MEGVDGQDPLVTREGRGVVTRYYMLEEDVMAALSRDDVKALWADTGRPLVSIFLPTHRAGAEIQQDPIRLKNLLKQAEEDLVRDGMRPAEARDFLAPVGDLVGDAGFWRHQSDGLAVFRSSTDLHVYRVPVAFKEFVSVSDRFYIKPLLPLLANEARFYVLALSHKAIRLLDCSGDSVTEVDLPAVPNSMEEALPEEGPAPQLQFQSLPLQGGRATRFHGHGVGTDDVDDVNLERYFHRVDAGLQGVLKHEHAPLVLACVEYLAPIYRRITAYRHVLDEVMEGNPDGLKNEDLHQNAWTIVQPHFQRARDTAAAQYKEGLAKGRASNSLAEILAAAYQGRVATLFVPLGVRRWGRFRPEMLEVEEHEQEQAGDELLDLAAMHTLLHAGTVYGVAPEEVPDQQTIAAVFRF
jgi:hypothetical protein